MARVSLQEAQIQKVSLPNTKKIKITSFAITIALKFILSQNRILKVNKRKLFFLMKKWNNKDRKNRG